MLQGSHVAIGDLGQADAVLQEQAMNNYFSLARGLPPEQITNDCVLSIILITFVIEIQSKVVVEVQIFRNIVTGPCLTDDHREKMATIALYSLASPAQTGSVR